MLELRSASPKDQALDAASTRQTPMTMSYGGDTLNTAVYLARLGIDVEYITALGDDSMSAWMIDNWKTEGVGCRFVERYKESSPGLYLIETDSVGERSFTYWRDQSPVRRMFDSAQKVQRVFARLCEFRYLFLSGITLALYDDSSLTRIFSMIKEYRSRGGIVIFDGNYRPRLWPSQASCQAAYETMYQLTDIAMPTLEDEQSLFGYADPQDVIARIRGLGVRELVLKMGAKGCFVVNDETDVCVGTRAVDVVDSTSAGDSFNAGFLAARLHRESLPDCAAAGHRLASVVIQHAGAIIPKSSMPERMYG